MPEHMLGPHVVGQRVVVRSRLPDGRATDLLGICLSWGDEGIVVQPAQGAPVTIAAADLITGKPVPPRASVRDRVTPREAQVHGFALFPDLVIEPLGDWILRDSATSTARRANSVLAFGPSGRDDDVAAVVQHYRRPVAAVLSGSAEETRLLSLGWVPESTEADTLFQVTATAQLARAMRAATAGRAERAARPERVETPQLLTASIGDVACGTAAYADDWLGVRDLRVAPAARRQGLALAVLADLVDWGAENGARTVYLQVLADNAPAVSLYESLGFRTHHTYRYLTPS